ncbi:LLM class flavin-dependent oxidoreductase, partial [Saccharothrix sp. MB29]|nr:LLM class flavin-dependent oxidoreductase [Saccharothrix sp. MB29]
FEEAGRRGVGVLGTTIWESAERVRRMIALYRDAAAACTDPVGARVNDQVAFFTFVHCAETDEQAVRNGAVAAAAWYTVKALNFLRAEAATTTGPTTAQQVIARVLEGDDVPDREIFEALNEQDSLIVGSPETCRRKMRTYADLGIDRLMTFHQVGGIKHEDVLTSLRLIGDLIPEFA